MIESRHSSTLQVADQDYLAVFNGALVALGVAPQTEGVAVVRDDSSIVECIGLGWTSIVHRNVLMEVAGLVRAVDVSAGLLFIITPVCPSLLHAVNRLIKVCLHSSSISPLCAGRHWPA